MKIIIQIEGARQMVRISEAVNAFNVVEVKKALADFHRYAETVIEMSEVDFIDSGFINLLAGIRRRFPSLYGRLKLANPQPLVLEIMECMHIQEIIPVISDEKMRGGLPVLTALS